MDQLKQPQILRKLTLQKETQELKHTELEGLFDTATLQKL